MSVRDEVVQALQSRGRVEPDTENADIINLVAAVRQLQDAVVLVAEHVDKLAARIPTGIR